MRWVCTERGKLVQESEFVIRLNGERADRARCVTVIFLKFVHRIKKLSAGSDGKKRRRGGLGGEAQRIQFACGGIELVGVDSFAAVVGVGADIQQIFLRWWLGVGGHGSQDEGDQEKNGEASFGAKIRLRHDYH